MSGLKYQREGPAGSWTRVEAEAGEGLWPQIEAWAWTRVGAGLGKGSGSGAGTQTEVWTGRGVKEGVRTGAGAEL